MTIRTILLESCLAGIAAVAYAGEDTTTPPATENLESDPANAPTESTPIPEENATPPPMPPTPPQPPSPPADTAAGGIPPMTAPAGYLISRQIAQGIGVPVEELVASTTDMANTIRGKVQELGLSGTARWSAALDAFANDRQGVARFAWSANVTPAEWNRNVVAKLDGVTEVLSAMGRFIADNGQRLGRLPNAIVDDVDDVRNDVRDLIQSIERTAPLARFPGWGTRDAMFGRATDKLAEIQQSIMQPNDPFDNAEPAAVTSALNDLSVMVQEIRQTLTFAE